MIEYEEAKSAKEFLEKLDLSQPQWSNNNWSSDWIFRGQADAEWPLTPSALRPQEDENDQIRISLQIGRLLDERWNFAQWAENSELYNLYGPEKIANLLIQIYAEINNLRDFLDLGEGMNLNDPLPLPSEFPKFSTIYAQQYLANLDSSDFIIKTWNKPFIAIAQHHGVKTRLRDWTKNPLYAAYFACEGIQHHTTNIAVYAALASLLVDDIRLIEVSKRHSPYIHSQQGIFAVDTKADIEFLKKGSWRGLEAIPNIPLRKFILPVQEVNELLRILWLKQITRAHMMPSLDNVILALKTKWKLQLKEHQRTRN